MTSTEVYVGTFIHSVSRECPLVIKENYAVGVRDGKIIFMEPEETLEELKTQFNFDDSNLCRTETGSFFMPGMIDTHIHAPQYANAGLGMDLPLMGWLEQYTFPLESKFEDTEFARLVYEKAVTRTLRNGTTTANYCTTIHLAATRVLADLVLALGQRAFLGVACKNSALFSNDKVLTTNEAVTDSAAFLDTASKLNSSRIRGSVIPRSALSSDEPLLRALAAQAKKWNAPIHVHMNECLPEIAKHKLNFPEYAGCTDLFDKIGILTPKTILAHCVYLTDSEISCVVKNGTSVAHCPNSNISLMSGFCPAKKLMKAGVKMGLATDLSGGYSVSMLDAMRHAIQTSKIIRINETDKVNVGECNELLTFKDAFYLATLGGAEALNIDTEVGNFMVGKSFDALLVDLKAEGSPVDVFPGESMLQVVQKFIMIGDDRNIRNVFIEGRHLIF